MKLIIEVEQNALGDVTVTVRNTRVRARLSRHMKEMTGNGMENVYLQGWHGDEFIDTKVPVRYRSWVRGYWPVAFKMEAPEVGNLYGWDAHTLFE